jgi:hypothetical protein
MVCPISNTITIALSSIIIRNPVTLCRKCDYSLIINNHLLRLIIDELVSLQTVRRHYILSLD